MKIKNISYSESREYNYDEGLRAWKRAGIEADLEPGESMEEAWEKAKKMVVDGLNTRLPAKPPAIAMQPDRTIQELYNDACEHANQTMMRSYQAVYPDIKYTGGKILENL